jgi:hypothetical protein
MGKHLPVDIAMQHRSHLPLIVYTLIASGLISLWPADAQAVDAKYLCNSSGSRCVSVTPTVPSQHFARCAVAVIT